jgi:hypothetical protein
VTAARDSGYLIPIARLDSAILEIRGERVMLDYDLAAIYGVTTKALNQAVKRNRDRFPAGFMFELTPDEKDELVTDCDRLAALKHSSSLPYAFTEHEAVMLADQRQFALKLAAHDKSFQVVFAALKQLMQPPAPKRGRIGFATGPDDNIVAHDRPSVKRRSR